jgi:UDPglucose 6-dehydrogenase
VIELIVCPAWIRSSRNRCRRFTIDLAEALQNSEMVFIAVGTPQTEDGSADLQHLLAARATSLTR